MDVKRYVIIVAGGSGIRMGIGTPKQFVELEQKPILMHTISVFAGLSNLPEIIVALPEVHIERWKELCQQHRFAARHKIVAGGNERFYSVKNGLNLVDDLNSVVAIHDGVRPLVSVAVVETCYRVAGQKGNAVPAIRPVESVRIEGNNGYSTSFPRHNVLLVQTPQVFRANLIKRCYDVPYNPNFTDDASVVEASGERIFTVEGNPENIKITTQSDLLTAGILLRNKNL
ncbi:MAG: 2-C-methyl-D-erythritol 4-phosphate cytidylyltransferase [Bacteroidales bacterium]